MVVAPRHALAAQLQGAIADALGEEHRGTDPLLAPSKSPAHDYQANFAMRLAKETGTNPRELAQQVAGRLGNGTVAKVARHRGWPSAS
jgi:arginyl-tRNA synthetase